MATPVPKTVGIVGAAIAGPTLALHILSHSILRASFRPILLDQTPPPGDSAGNGAAHGGATVGLFTNGLYPLRQLGIEDAVRAAGFECRAISTWGCGSRRAENKA